MALLSFDLIREIRSVADAYAQHERERLIQLGPRELADPKPRHRSSKKKTQGN